MVILGAMEILGHKNEVVGKKQILPERISKAMDRAGFVTAA